MADRINVCRDGKAIYDIVLTQSFDGLKEAVSCLPVKEHKICIVTDSNVAPLYLEEVRAVLAGCCKAVSVFTFPAGEEIRRADHYQVGESSRPGRRINIWIRCETCMST